MSVRIKIVMTAINIVCLFFTLLLPNQATPIALLPIIVTACAWLFTASDRNQRNKRRKSYYILLCLALALACACCLLAFFSSPQSLSECIGGMAFTFYSYVYLIGNRYVSYLLFAVTSLIVIFSLYIGEILQSLHSDPPPVSGLRSFNDEVMIRIEAWR